MPGKTRVFFIALVCIFVGFLILHHKNKNPECSSSGSVTVTLDAAALKDVHNIVPVAVIGSGPAGLSAALYAARAGLHVVVFKGGMPGGQLTGTSFVENWPGVGVARGPDIMSRFEQHVAQFGARFVAESIEHVDFGRWPYLLKTDEGKEVRALTVIIATGSSPLKLKVEGEDTYWGKGVSTCTVCDAPFYKNRPVAVVGGGDSAAESALELADGARHITVLVRGDAMRASAVMQKRLRACRNVEIHFNTQVRRITGDGSHVTGLDIENTKTQKHETLAVDALFLAIGHSPNTALFKDRIALDRQGYIALATRSQMTSMPGVFAAGDVADARYRQAGVASGDGIKAGLEAIAFLRDNGFDSALESALEDRYFTAETQAAAVKVPVIKTLAEYNAKISAEKRPVIIDFYAPWCPGCMRMMPVFEYAAAQLKNDVLFLKVDTSVSEELAKHFDIKNIPAVLVFKGGKLLSKSTEMMTKRQFIDYVKRFSA